MTRHLEAKASTTNRFVVALCVVLAVGALGLLYWTRDAPFVTAAESFQDQAPSAVDRCCDALVISIDGISLDNIDGLDDTIEAFAALDVLLDNLGFSSTVIDRIDSTRAIDGTQEAVGAHATAFWTYHPDNGLKVIFEPS